MTRERMAVIMGAVSLGLALAAFLLLVFLPVYAGTETDPQTQQQITLSATLIQVNGRGALVPMAIPPVLAAAGFTGILRVRKLRKLAAWIPASLLVVFVISSFSIGVFYLPAMAFMVASAVMVQ